MLEDIWHPSEGLDRLHYQGLIQAAISLEHFRKGNQVGAQGLFEKACEKWAQLPGEYMGVDLKQLKSRLETFLKTETQIESAPQIPLPQ